MSSTTAVEDPLLAHCELAFREEFYPYGFAVSVVSNSPAVLDAACVNWRGLNRIFDDRPLEIRCLVQRGDRLERPPAPVFRAQRNLLAAVADSENFWCADLRKGFASAWVAESALAHGDYLRYHFLDGMAYSMMDALRVVTIHAACVARNGLGVLLAGDSGAGKSSLAYACARRGWTYCSDDASALVRRAQDRVVMGNPRQFRFRASAGSLFPEFRGMKESRRANGKPTIEVALSSLRAIQTARSASVDYVVFLNRRADWRGSAQAEPVAPETAIGRLLHCPWPRELRACREHEKALSRLLAARLVELRYRDLDGAVNLLERLIGEN